MFVHLRLHTEFSVVDGTTRIGDVVSKAAKDGQPALAVTDLNNMFGALKLYTKARGKGVKPILGAEVSVAGAAGEASSRILLLVQNWEGYLSLNALLALAWTDNSREWGEAKVSLAQLEQYNEGLIALSGAHQGAIGQSLLRGDFPQAFERAMELARIFPQRFYIEVQRAGRKEDEAHVAQAVQLASKAGLPIVATHPVQFLTPDDFDSHEARVCISEGEILADQKRPRRFTREQYFKSTAQMQALFADIPAALDNTVEIAKRCNISLVLGKPQLPNFPIPDGLTIEEYFRKVSFEGLEDRLHLLFPDESKRDAERPRYVERLEFELSTILKMGFPGYFLIVSDFIQWAKENGCPVGPGRGSGAGSLVAYVLLITDLDPLQYNLLFERFLNPERVSMPDFDIDFCQSNRDRVIEYVKQKYGRDAVSQIATFGSMAARAAIRDVGRVMDMGYGFCDGISKLIPNKPGKPVTIQYPPPDLSEADKEKYAIAAEPLLAARIENEEEVKALVEMAQKLEGLTRNIGMHAGGVLIAPGKLTDFCPLYQQPGSESAVSQFDKDDVEAIGLVKFDFLGLATLTILELARQFIVARHPGQKHFAFEKLPLDDWPTYKLFQDGKTEAVFQFESRGMQGMLKEAKPSRLEDLIALNALYRPGPMDLIPSFVNRKHGKEDVEYPHPLVEPVLSETYGIMVYQEQVMQTAQILGGYSLGGADLLRRAMGKKKAEEMAKHRLIFREGAAKNNIEEAKADEIFDLMEKFAGYGFNKSHAAAYSLLAYHTAWLKVHYTAEFFCANMTIEMDDTDKLKVLLEDAQKFGIRFDPPDVNHGAYRFEPIGDKQIRYGLGAVKGTGQAAIEAIVAAREGKGEGDKGKEVGPFKSLFDFCLRVDKHKINKRTVDALIRAGAFDTIDPNRAALSATLDTAFEWAATQLANANQGGLFDMLGDDAVGASTQEPEMAAVMPWGIREQLLNEKAALGFFLSGHLFDEYEAEVRQFAKVPIADLEDTRDTQRVTGIISGVRSVNGQRGKIHIFTLDDKSGSIEATLDDAMMTACADRIKDDELVVLNVRYQPGRNGFEPRLNVQEVLNLPAARCAFGRWLMLDWSALDASHNAQHSLQQLQQWLDGNRPPAPPEPADNAYEDEGAPIKKTGVRLRIRMSCQAAPGSASVDMLMPQNQAIFPSDEALHALRVVNGGGGVKMVYS
ncbi:DNA polymerase III subunit alpha [Lampropedia puyangensis]|uniref:DNA polymerase III subunit alpha n=1 Tax=Lampropedia puyangensis TaxID=1330072 RepID=A0A4S8EUI4_9BURK|nr:DNA polymerase III subunit alpha [Lampropedia puyangensis]THT98108.1 DNA polymerase III subunit alpha [Lampropedia puyangensis]